MLISSDPGRSVYERLGYLPLLRFSLWAGHRAALIRRDGQWPVNSGRRFSRNAVMPST